MNIILASSSPARKGLMDALGITYRCHASEINEDMKKHEDPRLLAEYLATEKAKHIAAKYPDSLIIGGDTFMLIGRQKIGKAKNRAEAVKLLKKMSGNTIKIISGLSVIKTGPGAEVLEKHVSHAVTELKIKDLTAEELDYFSTRKEATSVAGVITIDGEGSRLIREINGDYNNVVGLPIFQLKEVLKKYGVETS